MRLLPYAESGGEYLLPWVNNKIRLWHQQMIDGNLAALSRTVQVNTDTVIYVTMLALGHGRFRDKVRIVAGSVVSLWYTAWLNSTDVPMATAGRPFPFLYVAGVTTHHEYLDQSAGKTWRSSWSKDRSTFVAVRSDAAAYGDGGAVVRRGGVEYTVASVLPFWDGRGTKYRAYQSPSSDSQPAPADAHDTAKFHGHYTFADAGVSKDGHRLVFRSSVFGETCVVLTWNATTVTYDQVRIALPAAALAIASSAPADVSVSNNSFSGAGFASYALTCSPVAPEHRPGTGPGNNTTPPSYAGALTVVAMQVNPYNAAQVLVQYAYDYITGSSVVGHSIPGVAPDATNYKDWESGGATGNVIALYNVLTGAWSDIYSDVRSHREYLVGDLVNNFFYGGWANGTQLAGVEYAARGHFAPDAGAFALSYNANTLSGTTVSVASTPPVNIGTGESAAATTTSDLSRNGAVVLTGLATDGAFETAQVGTTGTLLLVSHGATGKYGVVWKYGATLGQDVVVSSDPAALSPLALSKSGRLLLAKTVADTTWRLRRDGVLVWSSGAIVGATELADADALVYALFESEGFVGVVDSAYRPYSFRTRTSGVAPDTYELVPGTAYTTPITVKLMNSDGTEPTLVPPTDAADPTPEDFAATLATDFGYGSTAAFAADAGVTEADVVAACAAYLGGDATSLEALMVANLETQTGLTGQDLIDDWFGEPGHTDEDFRASLDGIADSAIESSPGYSPGDPGTPDTETIAAKLLLPSTCVGSA